MAIVVVCKVNSWHAWTGTRACRHGSAICQLYAFVTRPTRSCCSSRRRTREFNHGKETFLFCNGEWFQAEKDYVKKIRAEVAALADVTTMLALVPVKNGESEPLSEGMFFFSLINLPNQGREVYSASPFALS
jgi:hypothetical protein